ncbi:MAG TPA: hypothetical protein VF407_05750 [Polyangiaceae bacterium]
MRLHTKVALVAAVFSGALALSACGDADVGGQGSYKINGGDPSGDPNGGNNGNDGDNTGGGNTGGGGGDVDSGTSTGTSTGGTGGSFALSLASASLASELMATNTIAVTVTPAGGLTGSVALSATGLPSGVTATFSPASVDVSAGAATATMTVTVPSTITPFATAQNVSITGAGSGGATGNAPLALTVKRAITLSIPQNVEATPNAFGAAPIVIHAGTIGTGNAITVNVINKDTSVATGHIFHSTNTQNGFFHGDTGNPIKPGKSDAVRNVTGAGDYQFYCHGESDSNGNMNKPDNTLSIKVP